MTERRTKTAEALEAPRLDFIRHRDTAFINEVKHHMAVAPHLVPSDAKYEGRVVAEWSDDDGTYFLGSQPDSDFSMTMRLDTGRNSLLLWFELPVKIKRHRRAAHNLSQLLYVIIQAEDFDHEHEQCLTSEPLSEISTEEATSAALREANIGTLDSMVRMTLQLKETATVIMPKTDQPLHPSSQKCRTLLGLLKSLSQARTFHVYVPLNLEQRQRELSQLCELVSDRRMVNHDLDFTSFYTNGGKHNAWANYGLSDLPPHDDATTRDQVSGPILPAVVDTPPPYPESATIPPRVDQQHPDTTAEATTGTRSTTDVLQPEVFDDGETTHEDTPAQHDETTHEDAPNPPAQQEETNDSRTKDRKKKRSASGSAPARTVRQRVQFADQQPAVGRRAANRTRSSTRNSTPDSLRHDLARFLVWLADVDVELQHHYENLLWDMGDAASEGDGVGFHQLQAQCKAEVLVRYRRRRPEEV
ncbi:Di-copper centre-containing protein [Neofusicoccum parvum]|uniref:Di-copper centre-containing protein n=1 Tax=Neofusicoccum parvum TaxID=310453 RepID=A0ACB5SLM8_9PEZI|nr:Di-copper centre-containing protein [Neofusicoccum parvum]